MSRWSAIVLALPTAGGDAMASRLPRFLHPVAGRPLAWHVVAALGALDRPPERVGLVADPDTPTDLFQDLPLPVELVPLPPDGDFARLDAQIPLAGEHPVLAVDAAAGVTPELLQSLVGGEQVRWLAGPGGHGVAAWLPAPQVGPFFRLPAPLSPPNGVLAEPYRVAEAHDGLVVRDRRDLAVVTRRIRDGLVQQLMQGGVTFLLPETVLVDVEVRIGRDSVVYPGAVIEGQTTIGAETVIGPGCRILSSWIGSGVELKGWNYVAHTSIRNRAILEPYVRRGFD